LFLFPHHHLVPQRFNIKRGLGGVADDNSVLFELLASHGYVVMSSAYQFQDADRVHIGSDLHTSFRDLEFLARFSHELPLAGLGPCVTSATALPFPTLSVASNGPRWRVYSRGSDNLSQAPVPP